MSAAPIITFKAGLCDLDESSTPYKVQPKPAPGYISLYMDDDLHHFTWRPRSEPLSQPTIDLIMVPGDGTFSPYEAPSSGSDPKPLTNGRIYVLRFSSSSSRYLFWLQSKSQHPSGNASWFSPRDRKLGEIVNQLLQGEEVDVAEELANIPSNPDRDHGDDDEAMEDADNTGIGGDLHRAASGGAGADATGGDVREEGHEAREGGADGGRAATSGSTDAQAAVANFLKSLQGNPSFGSSQAQHPQGKPYTTLRDLLNTSTTLPVIATTSETSLDELLRHVPPILLLIAQNVDDISTANPDSETVDAILLSLSREQKEDILRKVLRSPQFSQSLGSLTMAIRDGGLPSIADALKIKVSNGGFMHRGGVPLGGGEAVEAFVNGIRSEVEEEVKDGEGRMETD